MSRKPFNSYKENVGRWLASLTYSPKFVNMAEADFQEFTDFTSQHLYEYASSPPYTF